MKTTVSAHDFLEAFKRQRPDQFSRAALLALFDYLEESERDQGEEYELDVIALCCDFAEYSSATEACLELGLEVDWEGMEEDEKETAAREYLQDRTTVIPFDGGIVIQSSF